MGDMGLGRLRVLVAAAAILATTLATAGCGQGGDEGHTSAEPDTDTSSSASDGHGSSAEPAKAGPLREGESRLTLKMPQPYTPSAPTGFGTDDYRCFLLDPKLDDDAWITGTNVLPGSRDVVHHVILFRVPPRQVAQAKELDEDVPGEGWTCFGGTGLDAFQGIDDAPWLGAWAPGGAESVNRAGYGVKLEKGSQIVMQVHYNLLAGDDPDVSATQLRLAPADADLTNLGTVLLPAPVELPCRPGHDASPLCDRGAAVADVKKRFGEGAGSTNDLLYFLCGGKPRPGDVQSCTRTLHEPMTIMGVAGHMHLLGRSIKIEVNPGTDRARTVLDIPIWDFDNQGAKPIKPVHLDTSDTVKVTCEHVQWLRDQLPSFEGQEERYVVWGEGTTDEMCLGILQVTKP
jgi:hypothetical protein